MFGARTYPGMWKRYSSASHPASPHFADQAPRYCQGQFKDVWFYPEQVAAHTERAYHPGE